VTGWYEKTPPDFVFAAKVVNEFLRRLRFFLKRLQCNQCSRAKFAVGIRNKTWLDAKFVDVLREHEQIIPPAGRV